MSPTMVTARHTLLDLHKTLLDEVRIDYEREHGRVEGAGALLQLVVSDPAFAWLRPLSQLIVALDEGASEGQPKSVRAMFERLVQKDDRFAAPYQAKLQASADVLVAHGKATRAVAALGI
ncbi:MAG: hypothetical protein KIT84_42635 [Labilithrix sp.]|nr:hypothetical protein [Labilithrix sp.]MCW5817775.1 hypothetical protein [Labilithrix sp.]